MEWPSILHEIAQVEQNKISVRQNESALDEMAWYSVKLYSVHVPSNGTALQEIQMVQRNIKWHRVE